MFRRVVLAAALSLVMAVFAGHGSFAGGAVHAAGVVNGPTVSPSHCSYGNYSASSTGPYDWVGCYVGESDGADGNAPDTDDDSGYYNEVGTESFAGLGCNAASIKNGQDYYNPTGWTEFDSYNPTSHVYTVQAHCTVQTGDTGITRNLLAYLYDSECDIQLFGDYALYGSGTSIATGNGYYGSSQLYEAESPTGTVTLFCNGTFHSKTG